MLTTIEPGTARGVAIAEVAWPARYDARRITPIDGYAVFGAVCRAGMVFHGQPDTQVLLVREELVIRAPVDRAWRLAGAGLNGIEVNGHSAWLGSPIVRPLVASPRLWSRLVTIKPYREPVGFAAAARRQLDRLGVTCGLRVGPRAIVRVADKAIVGFGAWLEDLSERDSLAVQSRGLGGRNRMGCGVFTPC
ncbi:MAG: type I-MYXAN CRISPR-associated protein Cas6/Cmx6 [Phycisphaerales bacterium]